MACRQSSRTQATSGHSKRSLQQTCVRSSSSILRPRHSTTNVTEVGRFLLASAYCDRPSSNNSSLNTRHFPAKALHTVQHGSLCCDTDSRRAGGGIVAESVGLTLKAGEIYVTTQICTELNMEGGSQRGRLGLQTSATRSDVLQEPRTARAGLKPHIACPERLYAFRDRPWT